MPTKLLRAALVGTALLSVTGSSKAGSVAADQYSPEVATAWMNLLVEAVKVERLPPTAASRLYGYAGVALYEAVCAGIPGHRSLGNQLNELGTVPKPKQALKYHWPSVVNTALANLLRSFFAGGTAPTLDAINDLEESFNSEFAAETRTRVQARSISYGQRIGSFFFEWSLSDGYSVYHNCPYTPPIGPGLWEPTPPDFRPALEPCWGSLRTFAMPASDFCYPPPRPDYSTDLSSEFHASALEVYNTSLTLTQEQRDIATFWADSPVVTGTPPGHWVKIVAILCNTYGFKLDLAAECYARVGLAVHDAFIHCWQVKYVENLVRPVTYIQDNIDVAWLPFLVNTPSFPTYTSGHSSQSGAVAQILTDLLGNLPFTDTSHQDLGYAARSFDSIWDAAEEAAVSRLYGGIHYTFDNDMGLASGQCVGLVIMGGISFTRE